MLHIDHIIIFSLLCYITKEEKNRPLGNWFLTFFTWFSIILFFRLLFYFISQQSCLIDVLSLCMWYKDTKRYSIDDKQDHIVKIFSQLFFLSSSVWIFFSSLDLMNDLITKLWSHILFIYFFLHVTGNTRVIPFWWWNFFFANIFSSY